MDFDVKEANLDGVKLTTSRSSALSSVDIYIRINAGSLDEYPRHPSGVAHFFEHSPLEGTLNFLGHAFDHAAKIKATINAETSLERTDYYITVPTEYWREGLKLVADVAQRAALDPQEIIEERDTIINEVRFRAKKNPNEKVGTFIERKFYDDDPRRTITIGERDSIRKMETAHLAAFRDEYYVRENCHVVIEGPVDHAEVEEAVRQEFSLPQSLKRGKPNRRAAFNASGGYHVYPIAGDVDTEFYLAFPFNPQKSSHRNFFLIAILEMYFSHSAGRVFDDMRNKNRLVYGIEALWTMSKSRGCFFIDCICAPEKTEEYLQKLVGHALDIVSDTVSRENFYTLKSIYLETVKAAHASKAAPGQGYIYWSHLYGNSAIDLEEENRIIESITFEDFQNFAREAMANQPTFIADGMVEGIVSKQRFEEIVSPLTAAANAYLAVPHEPNPQVKPRGRAARHERR